MSAILIVVIISILVAVFSAQNAATVAVSFLSWHFDASLAIVVLLSFLTGMIIGMALLSVIRLLRSSRKKKERETGKANSETAKSNG
jgi:uncharacterized integral membrane protein